VVIVPNRRGAARKATKSWSGYNPAMGLKLWQTRHKIADQSSKIVPLGAPFTFVFTTYVLRSEATGRFYTGSAPDFLRRLEQRNADMRTSTKHRGPSELAQRKDFASLAEAVRRERYLKTGKGPKR
jgi:predicted GIY-YIG superfamily endonuclease